MPVKILMVCLGNICRSPLAEGLLASKLPKDNFIVDSVLINQFYAFGKTKKAEPDSAENYTKSIPTIQNQLKGLIAQDLFNSSAYYQVTNVQNPIYIRALNAFTDGSFQKFGIMQEDATSIKNKKTKKEKSKRKKKSKDGITQ